MMIKPPPPLPAYSVPEAPAPGGKPPEHVDPPDPRFVANVAIPDVARSNYVTPAPMGSGADIFTPNNPRDSEA